MESDNRPLFYRNPMPLDAKAHKSFALRKNFGLEFTCEVNAVPINLIEMPRICHFYPIAFSPDGNATPVAILGLNDNENLFVLPDGRWQENVYIPAYIRRYPFIFSELPGTDSLSLCIDFSDDVVSEEGEQRFFNDQGQPSELSQNALEFCKSYHAAAIQTAEFSKWLAQSSLLVDREAQIKVGSKQINFSGFRIIDENHLAELEQDTFLELRKMGWLPFIYAHLFSGSTWSTLSRLLSERLPSPVGTESGKSIRSNDKTVRATLPTFKPITQALAQLSSAN